MFDYRAELINFYHACEVSTCRDSVEMSVAYKAKALNDKIEAKRLEK
jgi:hypothetical protein